MQVEEIKEAIEGLPRLEFVEIRKWISERDWQMWDHELEADSKEGKLDFLIQEAFDEKRQRRLKEL